MNELPITQGFGVRVQDRNIVKKPKIDVRGEDQYDIRIQDRNEMIRFQERVYGKKQKVDAPVKKAEVNVSKKPKIYDRPKKNQSSLLQKGK